MPVCAVLISEIAVREHPNADVVDAAAVVLAREEAVVALKRDEVVGEALVLAAAQLANLASQSSKNNAWKLKRPNARTWQKQWHPSQAPTITPATAEAPPRPLATTTL